MRWIKDLLERFITNVHIRELIAEIKKRINTTIELIKALLRNIYEYFLPLFEMWEFWLNNPIEYFKALKNPIDNPWWSAAATLPSFIGMVIHFVFWVVNPTIADYIIINFIW